jgi:hypothetical protein
LILAEFPVGEHETAGLPVLAGDRTLGATTSGGITNLLISQTKTGVKSFKRRIETSSPHCPRIAVLGVVGSLASAASDS